MSDAPTPPAPSEPTGPPPGRAQFWRDTLAEFAASGLSVRAFCLARGLHEKRFYTWRRDLGLSPAARPVPKAAPGFVPVRVVADAAAEITLPGGVTLRVPLTADPSHVARLVAALRGAAC